MDARNGRADRSETSTTRSPAAPRRLRRIGRLLGRAAWAAPAALLAGSTPLRAEGILETLTGQDPSQLTTPLRLLALVTVLGVVPSIVLMTTCFPRIVIVLSFLRRAIGTQDLPPNQILLGLALILTAAIMGPTWHRVYNDALTPYMEGRISEGDAYDRAIAPMKAFMLDRTMRAELRLFVDISRYEDDLAATGVDPADVQLRDLPLTIVLPAFLLSELKVAFQMGFVLFLPFLIIDLIVATTLISMGMLVLPPILISMPLKVMVFVMVDGWGLVVGELVKSFDVMASTV